MWCSLRAKRQLHFQKPTFITVPPWWPFWERPAAPGFPDRQKAGFLSALEASLVGPQLCPIILFSQVPQISLLASCSYLGASYLLSDYFSLYRNRSLEWTSSCKYSSVYTKWGWNHGKPELEGIVPVAHSKVSHIVKREEDCRVAH